MGRGRPPGGPSASRVGVRRGPRSRETFQLVSCLLVASPWLPHGTSCGALLYTSNVPTCLRPEEAMPAPTLGAGFFHGFLRDFLIYKAHCPQQAHWDVPGS